MQRKANHVVIDPIQWAKGELLNSQHAATAPQNADEFVAVAGGVEVARSCRTEAANGYLRIHARDEMRRYAYVRVFAFQASILPDLGLPHPALRALWKKAAPPPSPSLGAYHQQTVMHAPVTSGLRLFIQAVSDNGMDRCKPVGTGACMHACGPMEASTQVYCVGGGELGENKYGSMCAVRRMLHGGASSRSFLFLSASAWHAQM